MNIEVKRHSLSHILAQAVVSIYGDEVKLAIGPSIEYGFYYDIDFGDQKIGDENLKEIEKKMKKIVKQNQLIEQYSLPIDEAMAKLEKKWEIYKLEMAKDLKEKGETELSFFKNVSQQWDLMFDDMCSGPHVEKTLDIDAKAFKLTKVAGAYWKWDENNKMLTRIYGIGFENKQELDDHLTFLREAKKRDHRLIGKKMELFCFSDNVWLGLPMWQPMGWRLWRSIEDYWIAEHIAWWYEFVRTPHIWNQKLWETSGHWGFYSDSMYPTMEVGQTLEDAKAGKKAKESEHYLLKPMNCPFHIEIYKTRPRSYREFPLRWAETGTVYRYEKKWQLWGLTRVRGFTQDDAHIICRKDQVKAELSRVVDFVTNMLETFGLGYQAYLSFRDPNGGKYVWDNEMWEMSQNILKEISDEKWLNAPIEEWEAAFYGAKIDFKIKDCLGREHQCSTIQFDFNLPERFDMTYTNADGEEEKPYVIHRALLWSFERFIGVLIEHYAGIFPLWLAPRQVIIVPVSEKFDDYAKKVNQQFLEAGIRTEIDFSSGSLNKKVRNAEKAHINYILVIGEKEEKEGSVAVRNYKTKEQTELSVDNFIADVKKEIEDKVI